MVREYMHIYVGTLDYTAQQLATCRLSDTLKEGVAYYIRVYPLHKAFVELEQHKYSIACDRECDYTGRIHISKLERTTAALLSSDVSDEVDIMGLAIGYSITLCNPLARYLVDREDIRAYIGTSVGDYMSDTYNTNVTNVLTKYQRLVSQDTEYSCAPSISSGAKYRAMLVGYKYITYVNIVHDCQRFCIQSFTSNQLNIDAIKAKETTKIDSVIMTDGKECAQRISMHNKRTYISHYGDWIFDAKVSYISCGICLFLCVICAALYCDKDLFIRIRNYILDIYHCIENATLGMRRLYRGNNNINTQDVQDIELNNITTRDIEALERTRMLDA